MTTQFNIGIDWRRKGVICWEAQATDALNILPQPIRYTTLDWRTNSADSISREVQATDYGTLLFAVQSGTGANNGFVLGQSDALAVDTIPVNVSSSYSVSVRVRGITNFASVPLILRVKDQAGTTLGTSSAQTLSADWQMLDVSFTTEVESSHIMLEVIKDTDATDVLFQVTGVMLVEGNTMPSGYNAGATADLYDNITAHVMDAEWYLGFKKPYQEVPHGSVLKLELNNSDRRFSPEFVSGSNPLAGQVQALRPVQVRSDDDTNLRVHWSGWLESVKPTTNQYGERTAMLKASGPERLFANEETTIEIQENKRTDEIIERLLQEVQIPPALEMTTLIGVTGYNEIGSNAWLTDDLVVSRNLQAGKTTLAFAADNWVRRGAEGDQPDTFNIFRALKDTVAAERGRLYFDRTGQAIFWNRHNTVVNRTVAVTLDDTMHELAYEYASEGEFANDITVTCHPRTISAGENELLWQLENPIELQPGEEREIGASFRDDSDNRIGGRYLKLANVSYKQGNSSVPGTLVIEEAGANRAILMLRHQGTNGKVTLESAEVRGQKITDFGRVDATAKSTESMALYGHREMTLNLRAVDDQAYGQGIADFELMRRQTPLGKVQSVTLQSHGERGGNLHVQQLARTIGDRIAINETQTGHSDEYFIIGEEHKLSEQGTLLATTWFLESATRGDYFMIGEDEIGSEATLLPI